MAFQCTIVTPDSQVLDETVSQVILPAHDGQLGILTDHAPLLVKIGVGPLRADLGSGRSTNLFVNGGVAQMKDNKLTIVTDEALPPADIDAAATRADLEAALAREFSTPEGKALRDRSIARAKAKLAIIGQSA